jgi:hypothetical protein
LLQTADTLPQANAERQALKTQINSEGCGTKFFGNAKKPAKGAVSIYATIYGSSDEFVPDVIVHLVSDTWNGATQESFCKIVKHYAGGRIWHFMLR